MCQVIIHDKDLNDGRIYSLIKLLFSRNNSLPDNAVYKITRFCLHMDYVLNLVILLLFVLGNNNRLAIPTISFFRWPIAIRNATPNSCEMYGNRF